MDTLIAVIDDRLKAPGDSLPVAGHLDMASYSLGDHTFELPGGLDYDLVLTNAGEGILATGIIKTSVLGACDRCLDEARFDVAGELDEYYLFKAPDEPLEVGEGEDEVDYSLVGSDNTIDLTDAIMSALLMETPFVVLCREDCKGLCPVCGENLNEHDCGHAQKLAEQAEEERLANSPFAKLKDLNL